MNPFTSEKAPYAIALLIAALGWLLATLHGSVQGSQIIAHKVTAHGDEIVLRVTNLSKVEVINGVSLGLLCEGRAQCLRSPTPGGDFARSRRVPPVAAPVEFIATSPSQASFTTSLSPGASAEIVAFRTPGAEPPDVFLLPTPTGAAPKIYIVESHNPFAWFVAHYYLIMTLISLTLAAGFVAWLIANLLPLLRSKPKEPTDETRPAGPVPDRAGERGDAGPRPAQGAGGLTG